MNQVQPHLFVEQTYPYFVFAPLGFIIIALLALGWLIVGTAYSRYTGLTRGRSALLWVLASCLSIALLIEPQLHRNEGYGMHRFFYTAIFTILLPLLALPLAVRLYRKWIGGNLTEAEKLPGIDGVRAWLGVGNVICAALIPICVWQVFDYSPFGLMALTFGLLLAYPLFNMASHQTQPAPACSTEDLSSEREKVLQLLESGKISDVESA